MRGSLVVVVESNGLSCDSFYKAPNENQLRLICHCSQPFLIYVRCKFVEFWRKENVLDGILTRPISVAMHRVVTSCHTHLPS